MRNAELRLRSPKDADLISKVHKRAGKVGINPSDLMRQALRRGLDEMERDEQIVKRGRGENNAQG